jgi:ADP-heptose:LPS heptosyltransferase
LGDVILATAVLPALKAAFPAADIGFVCATWSRGLIDGHPLIDRVHIVDHWRLNRGEQSLASKVASYRRTRRQAIREIRTARYDAAIDLYCFYPNSADVLSGGKIPVRIGFTSGGFGPLFTHPVPYHYQPGRHVTEYYTDLLRCLGVGNQHLDKLRPVLRGLPDASFMLLEHELEVHGIRNSNFFLMHLGAGQEVKEWPLEKWRALVRRLRSAGQALVFVGKGRRERHHIEFVAEGLDGCVNLCDRLALPEVVGMVQRAQLLIAHDSVAAHIAAAVGTPSIVLATGIDPERWRPTSANSVVLSHPVHCSPCFISRGCSAMECVREVSVEEVYQSIRIAERADLNSPLS